MLGGLYFRKKQTRLHKVVSLRNNIVVLIHLNCLTTKKQATKFSSANFHKMLSSSYIILRIQRLGGKQRRSNIGGSS